MDSYFKKVLAVSIPKTDPGEPSTRAECYALLHIIDVADG